MKLMGTKVRNGQGETNGKKIKIGKKMKERGEGVKLS